MLCLVRNLMYLYVYCVLYGRLDIHLYAAGEAGVGCEMRMHIIVSFRFDFVFGPRRNTKTNILDLKRRYCYLSCVMGHLISPRVCLLFFHSLSLAHARSHTLTRTIANECMDTLSVACLRYKFFNLKMFNKHFGRSLTLPFSLAHSAKSSGTQHRQMFESTSPNFFGCKKERKRK